MIKVGKIADLLFHFDGKKTSERGFHRIGLLHAYLYGSTIEDPSLRVLPSAFYSDDDVWLDELNRAIDRSLHEKLFDELLDQFARDEDEASRAANLAKLQASLERIKGREGTVGALREMISDFFD